MMLVMSLVSRFANQANRYVRPQYANLVRSHAGQSARLLFANLFARLQRASRYVLLFAHLCANQYVLQNAPLPYANLFARLPYANRYALRSVRLDVHLL